MEEALLRAFKAGDPDQVWSASMALVRYARFATDQASRERFKANFGTDRCHSCTGLHAGPGVIATCFQTKQCLFSNLTNGQTTPRLQRALSKLSFDKKK